MGRIDRRNGEIAAFDARSVPHIAVFHDSACIPAGFFGIDFIKTAIHLYVPAHIIENEKFDFLAKIADFCNAALFQIRFSAFGYASWVALIWLLSIGVRNVATNNQGG